MESFLLQVKKLSVFYGSQQVLHEISFGMQPGETLAIVGESGSGKSTVLKAVAGLLGKGGRIEGGEILLEGREISRLPSGERKKLSGGEIAMIFQNAGASFCPVRTVGAQIYESVREHVSWNRGEFRERAREIMERIHLPERVLMEYPFRLSGGMGQRAGILAAMILSPKLLLADEPTSALDTVTQASVVEELMGIRERQGVSILMVTHHMGVAWAMADHVLVMKQGLAVEYGSKEQIFKSPKEAYTKELIDSVPRI